MAFFGYALRRAISLNLAISFIGVLVGTMARWGLAAQEPLPSAAPIAVAMMVGGMIGAAVASRWLSRISDVLLHSVVRSLLIAIGVVLIAEAVGSWNSPGLPVPELGRSAIGILAGVGIGAVSTLLGVAGGELIIPTLVLAFGLPIKAAGTMSLLISIPTMVVGLWHHYARGAFLEVGHLEQIVLPMAFGTVLGSTAGGWLVAYAPAGAVKLVLSCVLIASALRVFKVRVHTTTRLAPTSEPSREELR